jgi:hypothetical protein
MTRKRIPLPPTDQETTDHVNSKRVKMPDGSHIAARDMKLSDIPPEYLDRLRRETISLTWREWYTMLQVSRRSDFASLSHAFRRLIRDHGHSYLPQDTEDVGTVLAVNIHQRLQGPVVVLSQRLGLTPSALIDKMLTDHLGDYVAEAEALERRIDELAGRVGPGPAAHGSAGGQPRPAGGAR